MEIQCCKCDLCKDLRKNLQPLVFNDLDTENCSPSDVCDEPNLTIEDASNTPLVIDDTTTHAIITANATIPISTSTLFIDDPMSPDNRMDGTIPTLIIDETISSDITMEATIPTLIIDEPMSSDNTDDTTIPKLVIDETTSPTVTHVTLGGLSELENLFKNLIFNKK